MKTEELESKLEASTETQTLDIKAACEWNVGSLAKDILAMSNVRDGGYIIFGVEDGTFIRHGITPQQKITFNEEIMLDQMAPYADPHVRFSLYFPQDSQGMEYAVIRVFPFEEIPVICRRDGVDVRAGVIYYRNKSGRIQSAAVSNSYDMRDIIEVAAVKKMQRMEGLRLLPQVAPAAEEVLRARLDQELNGL